MGEITQIDNYYTDVVEPLIISFFEDAENFRKLLQVILVESDELEQTWYDLFAASTLEEGEGAQLDQWGLIVGQPRPDSMTDADYRKLLLVKIEANLSEGEAWRMADIAAKLLEVPVRYVQHGRAHFSLLWIIGAVHSTTTWMDVVIELIEFARPAGVSTDLVEGVTGAFTYDIGPGYDQGKLAQRWL